MCIYRRRIFFAGLHILAPLFPIHSVGARTLQAQRIETKLNQKPVIEVSGGVITKDAMRALSLVRGLHFSPKQNLVDLIFAALRNETVQTKGGQSGYVDRIFRMDGLPWVELMGRKAKWKVPLFQIEPPQQVVSKRLNIPREQRLDPPVVTELLRDASDSLGSVPTYFEYLALPSTIRDTIAEELLVLLDDPFGLVGLSLPYRPLTSEHELPIPKHPDPRNSAYFTGIVKGREGVKHTVIVYATYDIFGIDAGDRAVKYEVWVDPPVEDGKGTSVSTSSFPGTLSPKNP